MAKQLSIYIYIMKIITGYNIEIVKCEIVAKLVSTGRQA